METLPVRSTAGSWSQTGGFMRADCISTSWLWNLHADAHDFRGHTSDLDNLSRRVFASHFGHLSLIFTWLSGMYFSDARFSNYESWLQDPTHVRPSSQVAWAGLNQDVLNGGRTDVAPKWISCTLGVMASGSNTWLGPG